MFGNIKRLIPHANQVNPDASSPPIGHLGWDRSAEIQLQLVRVRVRLGGELYGKQLGVHLSLHPARSLATAASNAKYSELSIR
jgi:hypothetical protein